MIVVPRLSLYGPRNDNIYMGMMSTAHLFSVGTLGHNASEIRGGVLQLRFQAPRVT